MLIRIKDSSADKFRDYDLDTKAVFIVTALYFSRDNNGAGLRYLTNANVKKQGGLPTAFSDEDVILEDGYIPKHWVAAEQTDVYGRHKTIMTYPEWANDPDYYEKMDDNEIDNMRAINQYGKELKELVAHYESSNISNLYLEPFGAGNK